MGLFSTKARVSGDETLLEISILDLIQIISHNFCPRDKIGFQV